MIRFAKHHPLTLADCAALRRAVWPMLILGAGILTLLIIRELVAYEAMLAASSGV